MKIRTFIAAALIALPATTSVAQQQGATPPVPAAVPAAARPEVLGLLQQGGTLVMTQAGLAIVTAAGLTVVVASLGGSTVSTTSTN